MWGVTVTCPLCGQRKARRRCPALGRDICPACCGTKRLGEIACPADCGYLASSREHPAAVVLRQQQRDTAFLYRVLTDFSERQSRLLLLVLTLVKQYTPPDLQRLVDEDVRDAADALAATFETSEKGLIYEHRPASIPAGHLLDAILPTLREAGAKGGAVFEREATAVLRRAGQSVEDAKALDPGNRWALLDWLDRVLRDSKPDAEPTAEAPADASRLIVP